MAKEQRHNLFCVYALTCVCTFAHMLVSTYTYPLSYSKFPTLFTIDKLLTDKWGIGMTQS